MKYSSIIISTLFCAILLSSIIACKKKTEDVAECKTCKATSIDGMPVEKQVCTDAEEKKFRDDNPGAQITCN